MKYNKLFAIASTLVMVVSLVGVVPAGAASLPAGAPVIRQISSSLVTSFPTVSSGADVNGVQTPEIQSEAASGATHAPQPASASHPLVHRSKSQEDGGSSDPLHSPRVQPSPVVSNNPGLNLSFTGLNLRDQRLANGGNQFTVEPPDQGMCVGNGYVLETVNDVLRVFSTSGSAVTGVIDLNTFFGYPAQINRTTGNQGPFVTDPSCYFDTSYHRWFVDVLTLDVDPSTGNFLGSNHIDLAVSNSADPTSTFTVYRIPVQDDGTSGTPNHGCSLGPCIGDYPHIGADANGFYVTTNEYSLFGPEFKAAQIYAFSKKALAQNASTISVVQFDTTGMVASHNGTQPGFTVWPAEFAAGNYVSKAGGTEFFLSSNAAEEANGVSGGSFSNEIVTWAITNTGSLNSSTPNLALTNKVIQSETYGIPPVSDQKVGSVPLVDALNLDLLGFGAPPTTQVEGPLDSNDTRMQQVWGVNGQLWGALDTVVHVGGQDKAGIAYFVVSANVNNGGLHAEIANQSYIGVAGNNVNYPAIALLPNGTGALAFTLVGKNYYPSAGYVTVSHGGVGPIHVAGAGVGPQDGFTETFIGGGRPRWGDYGAAVTDGSSVWIASEYIAQTCTLAQYEASTSCGGTRVTLGNWATRISQFKP